jgi:DUF2905 family protein
MSRTLIFLGLILVAVGLLWRWIGVLRLGRLPGDIVVQHQNFTFYFPVATGLLISVVLTLILWFTGRWTTHLAVAAEASPTRRKQAMRRAEIRSPP